MKDFHEKGANKKKQHNSSPEEDVLKKQPASAETSSTSALMLAERTSTRTKAETKKREPNCQAKTINEQYEYSQPKPKRLTKECIENICSILPLYNGSTTTNTTNFVSLNYVKRNVYGFSEASRMSRITFEHNMCDRIIIYNIPNTNQKRYGLKSSSSQRTATNVHSNSLLHVHSNKHDRLASDDTRFFTDTNPLHAKKKTPKCKVNKVCIAEDHLIQMMQQNQLHRDHVDRELMDMPKETIRSLPFYKHKNQKKIVFITSPSESNAAVLSIRKELDAETYSYDTTTATTFTYLGLDTETRPKFHKGDPYPPALMQIATSTTAYLFRLTYDNKIIGQKCPMTKSLHALLADPSIIKIGVGIHKDIVEIKQFYGPKWCGDGTSYLDLRHIVNTRWPNLRRRGLRPLTATVLHYRLNKSQQMADWGQEEYSPAMMQYAANDAFVALDLFYKIMEV